MAIRCGTTDRFFVLLVSTRQKLDLMRNVRVRWALAKKATARLQQLLAGGVANLERVACACNPGTEGTQQCNHGRLCGRLTVGGRDVDSILIAEGLAEPFKCWATSCPRRKDWCRS